MRTQNNVKDAKGKEENDELKDTSVCLETDHVEKPDNSVLRKLLAGPRYFNPAYDDYRNCYNCGENSHTVTNCTAAKRKKPCFLCGSLEHNARHCKRRKKCFYCRKPGHQAKDCSEKSTEGFEKAKFCLKCGDSGHEMYTCKTVFPSVDDLKEIQCYSCKYTGHLCCVDYGDVPNEISCYRCGQLGHTGLKCTSVSSSAIAHTEASPSYCYKCGQEGHKPRRCRTSVKKRKRRRKNAKQNLQDNTDPAGFRSAPQEPGEGFRGGWTGEDPGGSCLRDPVGIVVKTG